MSKILTLENTNKNKNFSFCLVFCSLNRIFAPMNLTKRRQYVSWMLLAVFVPMLLLSSLHIHESSVSAETECTDCVHHNCHGHLSQTASWADDCVLCHFLTLPMLTAAVVVAALIVNVCRKCHILPTSNYYAACYDCIVTRGPPSVDF
jgi:Ca2+/H+ antiporter